MYRKTLQLAFAMLCFASSPALAKEYVVQMKNQGADGTMVFDPPYVSAKVGDVVRFVPTDLGHNAGPIPLKGLLPDGVALPVGSLNAEYSVRLAAPGLYAIRCTPHYSMGMVALIKAGSGPAANAAAFAAATAKLPPLAQRRMSTLLARAR